MSGDEQSDEDIVSSILQGQIALFEVLMRRHGGRIYTTTRAILRDDHEAEDVIQQAYLNAYAHLGQFDRRATFATWLRRIAVNEAITREKKRRRCAAIKIEETIAPDPERLTFARELGALLEAAIADLPDGCREVFMLREIEGMSTSETAAVLGVNEDVVKTRLSRAKARLRRDLLEISGRPLHLTAAGKRSHTG